MNKIDFLKLRKIAGISQKELADMLQVRPSFLSAIENGKSRMPEEKLDKIKEIFELDNLDEYLIEEREEHIIPPHTHGIDQGDAITQLLNHFHELAHQKERAQSGCDEDMKSRLEFLTKRNDRLSDRIDDLREEVDKLRAENLRLKELLLLNNIKFSTTPNS